MLRILTTAVKLDCGTPFCRAFFSRASLDGCFYKVTDNKQILNAFLFNIRNYSPEVINIILPRVNNFDIKQKKAWNICFIICHQHQTRSGKIKTNKTQQISVKTQVFFVKTELRHI